jgi:hypothetical protein
LSPLACLGYFPHYNNYDIIDKNTQGGLMRFKGNIHAPEFPKGLEWINTPRPLTMQDLRGKIVLLEFWTHG